MIRKILKLQNVGLLHDAIQGGAVDLAKVCGIYGDNGRGKSTFAAVMRACALADAARLNARKTIDSLGAPEIDFLLPTGSHVEFKNNAWSGNSPRIVVFDSEFVEQNVYSGFEVRADQRQSLLEFALGDEAVKFKQRVDQLTQDIENQTRRLTLTQKELSGHAPLYTVAQFIALKAISDAQQQIEALQKRIDAARNVQQLRARQVPSALQTVQLDVPAVFDVLRWRLQDLEQAAEAIVKAHLAKHGAHGLEDWISQGQTYLTGDECPFCGQPVKGLALIQAYRSHFNKAYADLKRIVATLDEQIGMKLADGTADTLRAAAETNTARIEAWKDRLDVSAPVLAVDSLLAALKQARETLRGLIAAKRSTPLEAIGSQTEQEAVAGAMDSVNQFIAAYNNDLSVVSAKIADFKQKLAAENVTILQSEIKKLEAAQRRQQPAAVAAVAEYQAAETERKRLQGEKVKAREQIDALMTATLQQYQVSINTLLATFGAEFSIEQLKHTSVGSGEPRTEYALSLRNKSVKLGSRADLAANHSFATTLSDSDKRTLAFAFFFARLKTDPNLANSVVVLDDPVSSLDRNRRYQSIRLIAGFATECQQLIVLSHDPYFIRELRERLADLKPNPITLGIMSIKRVQNSYSAFGGCDIDDMCSSDYYRHHRLVADFVDGKPTASTRDVAKAIRPLLEGYYHRRFPRRIPRKLMFGQIIALAAQAQAGDPLAYLQPLLKEMGEVNDYAGQFHHDTNPGFETAPVVDGELIGFAKGALKLIYENG